MAWNQRNQYEGGYLMVDHRASPGIPEDIAQRLGVGDPKLYGEGKLLEVSTLTCAHCKNAVVKNPLRTRARENCPKCGNHYICDFCFAESCSPDYIHVPYDKKRDLIIEGKDFALGSPGKLLGR